MLVNYEKQNGVYKRYSQLPLTARPLDLLYFLFFAVCTVPPLARLLYILTNIFPLSLFLNIHHSNPHLATTFAKQVHLSATLIVDLQYLYPPSWIPGFMQNLLSFYIYMSKDPLMGG